MAGRNVDAKTTRAIQAFLGYLHDHYNKRINNRDPNLIMAVAAWFIQESGGLSRVIGNNPFNIRVSPLQSGYRVSKNGNGRFAVFSSMAKGFEAAAFLLMHGGWGSGKKDQDAYGYRLALNALKKGGNQGANDFLAALAMSKWDAAHYGSHNWTEAYQAKHNHLIRNYLTYGGVILDAPATDKPRKPIPPLAKDFNFKVAPNNFLDPWYALRLYQSRRRSGSVAPKDPRR